MKISINNVYFYTNYVSKKSWCKTFRMVIIPHIQFTWTHYNTETSFNNVFVLGFEWILWEVGISILAISKEK